MVLISCPTCQKPKKATSTPKRSRKRNNDTDLQASAEDVDLDNHVRSLRKVDYELDEESQKTFEAFVAGALTVSSEKGPVKSGQNGNVETFAKALTMTSFNFGNSHQKEGIRVEATKGEANEDEVGVEGAKEVLTMVKNYSRSTKSKSGTDSLARKVVQTFSSYFTPQQLSLLHKTMQRNNVEWLNPKVCFMLDALNLHPDKADPRYSQKYLAPVPTEVCFDPMKPVGTFVLNFASKVFVDGDEKSRQITRGDMVNKQAWKFVPSRLEGLLRVYYLVPRLLKHGEAWSNVRLHRCDGTQGIFLCHYKVVSKENMVCRVRFQDVSDRMLDILALPDLF